VSVGWAQDYRKLWDTMTVSADWQKKANAIATRIVASQGRYAAAVAGTSVPWWFVAVVHAMECSLRFDQHLHNGDPLTARTVQVPKNRPPAGNPPFTWAQSARDAIEFERLTSIVDWSLENVLFNWHRYNGINNEYKRKGIPTPYLWSGSQHYRKGKYVRDGVFDANAVSAQVGAAVLLKSLVDLGAVKLGAVAVESNGAAATGNTNVLLIDTSGTDFAHAANELDYPGRLKKGAGTTPFEVKSVRRIQEWLNIHGVVTPVDGRFGDSTTDQLKAFQTAHGRPATGELDEESWALLTAPMRHALAKVELAPGAALEDVVVAVGKQHIAQHPIEVGGNNRGPWVRLYMRGQEGESQAWCAGFVYFVVAQAARDLNESAPFPRQVWVPTLVAEAKASGRLVLAEDVNTPMKRASKVRPGHIFVVRGANPAYTHTGIVLALKESSFDTLEGNTGGDGGVDGANARQGNRAFGSNDFLHLL
ncbi:MAG: peptidoglycan-binding protein, partial [Bradyrhizobium sp.]|nr:peptidoglycan-binding protein [Bradyrhizobium sp.]